MDANETKYKLVLGKPDWDAFRPEFAGQLAPGIDGDAAGGVDDGAPAVAWDPSRAALTLWKRVFQFRAGTSRTLSLEARRGAARDRFGNWYFIDESKTSVRVVSSGSGLTTQFWPPEAPIETSPLPPGGDFEPLESPALSPNSLCGLAVTAQHYLVVGSVAPAGLLIFDLHAGGPPSFEVWPSATGFEPFDMATTADGGLLILDRKHRAYWALDRHLKVVRQPPAAVVPVVDDFANLDGSPQEPPRQLVLASPIALGASDPIAIEALPDGTVLVLDRKPDPLQASSALRRYRFATELGAPLVLRDAMLSRLEDPTAPFSLVAHDFAVAAKPLRLLVAADSGVQVFAFDLELSEASLALEASADYFPMRSFGGRALVASSEHVYYDFDETFLELVSQPRARYRQTAVLVSEVFDGFEPDCVWHRLILDANIPDSAAVQLWSRAANSQQDLLQNRLAWQREPNPAFRPEGSELPYAASTARRLESGTDGSWELLFQRAAGRYFQLRLRLSGDETTTPELRALRAYYPRFSYAKRYLPAVYREDEVSASFVERLLALFEGFFTTIEDRIAATQVLLDAQSAPSEALDWLAGFFGVALDPAWDETRRRLFIGNALAFFRARGTLRGLRMALELAISRCPDASLFAERGSGRGDEIRIVEKFRLRRAPGVVLGDPTDLEGVRALPDVSGRWTPEQGRQRLNDEYRGVLQRSGFEPLPSAFPLQPPFDASNGIWTAFCRAVLGFVPIAAETQASRWQAFLRRVYQDVAALNQAYGSSYVDLSQVTLPAELPADGARLTDWYRFEGVLALATYAHRFDVVLPVPPAESGNLRTFQERRRLAERIVELEKPAHTVFDVKFYWAVFRVGDARLALDTQIHQGSRAPELLGPLLLGESYLVSSYLSPRPPQDASDRQIVGRAPLYR